MVLPSQSGRPLARHSHMYRRKRMRRAAWGLLVVVLAIPAYFLIAGVVGGSDDAPGEGAGGEDRVAAGVGGLAGLNGDAADNTRQVIDRDAGETRVNRDGDTDTATPGGGGDETGQGVDSGTTGAMEATRTEDPPPSEPDDAGADLPDGVSTTDIIRWRSGMMQALRLMVDEPIRARELLTRAYLSGALGDQDRHRVRVNLSKLNEKLVFGPAIAADDPFSRSYVVQQNDSLSMIVQQQSLLVDWRFIKRINGLPKATSVQAGQDLKLVTGPFHLVVDKSHFRADLYLGDGDDRVYVRSFKVGLGEFDSTPVGTFRVSTKLENPEWRNPRGGRELYLADDPNNPIGEHWIGLQGVDDSTEALSGYGIHGTIEPDSIGRQQSMGCIRMLPEDVKLVFELLTRNASIIEITP